MQWLGHVGHMTMIGYVPKIMLFGELKKKRPGHGSKKRWRDLVLSVLQQLTVGTTCANIELSGTSTDRRW